MFMRVNKFCLAAVLAAFGLGWACHRYYSPKPVSSSTATEQTRVRTITRIVERNGVKETIIDSTDNSTAVKNTVKASKSQWLVGVGAAYSFADLKPVYEASASKRILGPVFIGVKADTNATVGIIATLEF